jgi:hypothetical protein
MKSLDSAEKISEELWRLNATVLIAQSEGNNPALV